MDLMTIYARVQHVKPRVKLHCTDGVQTYIGALST